MHTYFWAAITILTTNLKFVKRPLQISNLVFKVACVLKCISSVDCRPIVHNVSIECLRLLLDRARLYQKRFSYFATPVPNTCVFANLCRRKPLGHSTSMDTFTNFAQLYSFFCFKHIQYVAPQPNHISITTTSAHAISS